MVQVRHWKLLNKQKLKYYVKYDKIKSKKPVERAKTEVDKWV